MLTLALVLTAHAGEDACRACCRVGGLPTCDAALQVYGDGSRLSRDSGAWRIYGIWRIGCDGRGVFDPSAVATLDHPPLGGELVMEPTNPLQVHCFQQACGLPVGTCISPPDEDGRFYLLECGTGLPVDAATLGRAPAADKYGAGTVVVVDGRPLVVAPGGPSPGAATSVATSVAAPTAAAPTTSWAPTTSAPTTSWTPSPAAAPTAAPAAPQSWAPTASPAPAASTAAAGPVTSWSAPAGPVTSWSAPAPAAAPAAPPSGASYASVPTSAPAAPSAPTAYAAAAPAPTATPTYPAAPAAPAAPSAPAALDPYATFATSLPKDPPDACTAPAEALRGEARRRVDLGDEKRLRKDPVGALQEYRAALTMDVCNAYGWLGVGEIASEAARPDLAVRALTNTTRLLPGHYGAWTLLGKAYETLRQNQLAAEAYGEALALRPNQPDALAGWRRTATPATP